MLTTNHTQQARVKASELLDDYRGVKYKEGDYVPYIDPSSVLHWLGGSVLPVFTMPIGTVMKVYKDINYGLVVEYCDRYKDPDTLLSLAIAHEKLKHIQCGGECIVYYEWGGLLSPMEIEMASEFVRELFKHNEVVEEEV